MSVKVMGGVWDLALDPPAKFVLLALADHADHNGRNAHPSVRLLAHKTGYSPRQVQRILRELQTLELIEPTGDTQGGRGHSVHYTIQLEKGDILTPFGKDDTGVRVYARKGDIQDTERVTSETGKGDIPLRAHVDKDLTVKEPSLDVGASRRVSLWESFVADYRDEKNKPAAIGRFYEAVTGRAPDYPRLAKMLKESGSGEAVGKAILEASAHHHTDDPLDYIHATLKRTGHRNGLSPDSVDWSKYKGDGYLAVRGRVD